MKGIVFTEFQQLVEEQFGLEMYDRLLSEVPTQTQGAYTSVGTYDYQEIVQLVSQLSQHAGIGVPELIRAFGRRLFHSFTVAYPHSILGITSTAELLQNVESVIHVEVRKLNPDAELPTFEIIELENNDIEVLYHSTRPFADLANGLIEASIEYFDDGYQLTREDLASDGTAAKFSLYQQSKVIACTT